MPSWRGRLSLSKTLLDITVVQDAERGFELLPGLSQFKLQMGRRIVIELEAATVRTLSQGFWQGGEPFTKQDLGLFLKRVTQFVLWWAMGIHSTISDNSCLSFIGMLM